MQEEKKVSSYIPARVTALNAGGEVSEGNKENVSDNA